MGGRKGSYVLTRENIFLLVGALVAVFLQLFMAPYIGLFSAVPNFLVAFAMAVAVVRPASYGCVMPFVLGLFFDFAGGGPIGAMAFSLTAFSVLASRIFMRVDNDSVFMAFVLMAIGVLLIDFSYAVLMLASGFAGSIVDAIVYRAFPCFVYDFVLAMIAYPIVARFAKPAGVLRTELTQLR